MVQNDIVSCRELWVSDKFSFMPAVTPTAAQTGWSTANKVAGQRTVDANSAVTAIGDSLCELVDDLIAKGIISA